MYVICTTALSGEFYPLVIGIKEADAYPIGRAPTATPLLPSAMRVKANFLYNKKFGDNGVLRGGAGTEGCCWVHAPPFTEGYVLPKAPQSPSHSSQVAVRPRQKASCTQHGDQCLPPGLCPCTTGGARSLPPSPRRL